MAVVARRWRRCTRGVIRNQVYVYIDGKQVTATVKQHIKRHAARSEKEA